MAKKDAKNIPRERRDRRPETEVDDGCPMPEAVLSRPLTVDELKRKTGDRSGSPLTL